MSRRQTACAFTPIVAGLAALALAGCGRNEPPAQPPTVVAVPAPVAQAEPAPSITPTPVPVAAPTPSAFVPAAIPPAPPRAPAPDPNAKSVEKPVDPLQWLQDSEARRADHQRRLAEAEGELAESAAPVALWERNLLAFKNPFLARPKLAPDDSDTIAGMDGVARVRFAEGRLAEAKAARDAAQKKLDDLKANPPQN